MERAGISFSENPELRFLLFGGKGGTGKTTSAAAVALYLAEQNADKRILVASTDPAHSLGDSFGCPSGNESTRVDGVSNLYTMEMDAELLLEEFRETYGDIMKKIADRGTFFDKDDIASFFELSLPGMDEVMAIMRLADIFDEGYYDYVVLDTAPTGHTVRMLDLPEQMTRWLEVLDLMLEKHRYLSRHFSGRYVKDKTDEFLEDMGGRVDRVESLLRNGATTGFVAVTIPESMAINETERLLSSLGKPGISVTCVIVNRVVEESECPFCGMRRAGQEKELAEIEEKFGAHKIVEMPLFPCEIQGLSRLREYGGVLLGIESPRDRAGTAARSEEPLPDDLGKNLQLGTEELRFLIVGGKGGVGKTTTSTALGIGIAEIQPTRRMLVFSTDPAHSLTDSLEMTVGDEITAIEGYSNLWALEIDAQALLEEFKRKYREDIRAIFDRFLAGGIDIKFDREVMEELITLSPPGLDEIMALSRIMDLMEEERFDLFILDTAPTGHLLRFLELPEVAREWLRAILQLLIKYKGVVRLTGIAERLLDLAKGVRKIREAFVDPERCEFVGVTIPEVMATAEVGRLTGTLRKLGVPFQNLVVNMVIPPVECGFCATKREEQLRNLNRIIDEYEEINVIAVPLFDHEITSPGGLRDVSSCILGDG
ncbi:MAG: ArsA family ATPase [Actinobacteria bacterium]|nr:ArsA family ATPase [Actinomycetota bacterium]